MKIDDSKKELLKLEELSSCYLYISTSDSVLEDKIESVKNFLKGKINFDTDFKVFDGAEEIDEEEFGNYVNTPSLFSTKKIAVIKYVEKVPVSLQKEIINSISSKGNDGANIIFIITALKQKFNPKLLDAVREAGKVVQLKPPLSGDLRRWLEERSGSDGIKFTDEAESLLIENVNLDLNLLKREYEKLYDYIYSEDKKIIDESVVRFLVNRIYSLKIFDLVDFIGKRDKDGSLKTLQSLLQEDRNLIGLITLVHRMFKCFLYIKSGNGKSSVTDYIENNIKVPPYFVGKLVSKYIKLSSNYTESEILKIFEILNKYDISFRTNSGEDKHLVKKLISEIIDVET